MPSAVARWILSECCIDKRLLSKDRLDEALEERVAGAAQQGGCHGGAAM